MKIRSPRMAREETLTATDFKTEDLRTLDEIAQQVSACKQAAEKSGKSASVLVVFLKMVDERMGKFAGELRERMKVAARA
jgi:hypothetical protein